MKHTQRYDGAARRLPVWNSLNYTRIEKVHIALKKTFIFWYVAVICTTTGGTDRGAGAAVGQGSAKELRVMETYKKQKIVTNYVCFCSSTMLISNIITEIFKNYSEFCGCANTCKNLFKVDPDKPLNYLWNCYKKAPPPNCPLFSKGSGQFPLSPTSQGREQIRACVSRYDQSAWTVNEARSDAHIASTGVRLY